MGYQKSYSLIFNKYWDTFRQRIVEVADTTDSQTENVQRMKDLFSQTIIKMLLEINPDLDINQEDIVYLSTATTHGLAKETNDVVNRLLNDENYPKHYKISDKLLGEPKFVEIIAESDMIPDFDKFAELTTNRIEHITKKADKTQNGKKIIHIENGKK